MAIGNGETLRVHENHEHNIVKAKFRTAEPQSMAGTRHFDAEGRRSLEPKWQRKQETKTERYREREKESTSTNPIPRAASVNSLGL